MARNYLVLTQGDADKKIAEGISSREHELMAYDFEADSHNLAIATLGNIQWSDANRKYKNMDRDQMIALATHDGLSESEILTIANLRALDRHRLNLLAVKVEIAHSEKSYNALLAALPDGDRRAAAFAAVAKSSDVKNDQ